MEGMQMSDDLEYWREGTKIIEDCLAKAVKADPGDVPFPLIGAEAKLWHQAQTVAYQHALEMMGWTESVAAPAKPHWPDCALNHGGTECDMGPECGTGDRDPTAQWRETWEQK